LNSFRGERIRREIFTPLLSKSKKEAISLRPNKKKLKYFLLYLVKAKKDGKSNLQIKIIY